MAPFQVTTKAFRLAGFVASVGLVFTLTIVPAMVLTFGQDLPTFSSVEEYRPKLISRVYSVDGRLIGEFGTEKRRIISYERIPKRLIQAFIATEDKNFFDHGGIDWLGIVRAVVFKVIGKSERIGGTSTITQQLAKGLLIDQDGFDAGTERSIRRKVREGLLARRLESTLTKEEILWIYLNHVYLGHGAYGVQAAAENYFRKDVGELDVAEMSLIAGLPQAPSRFSPFVNPKQARARQQIVLLRMVNNGFITAAEREAALARSVEQTAHARDDRFRDTAPYFTEHVRRYIYDTYGEKALYTGGLEIHTTLNLERQAHAEEALVNGLREVDKRQGYRGPIARGVLDDKKQAALLAHIDTVWLKDGEPVKGEDYLALVTAVDGKKQLAEIRIGTSVTGVLPLAGLRWARTPNPNQYWEANLVDNIKSVLKPGDVILVMLSDREELSEQAMNAVGLDSIPERPKDGKVSPDPNVPLPLWARPLFVLDQVPEVQGALIAMNPHTGYVEAMIGGYAFEQSEFNRAFQACRQPGSTFKPIVYSAAIAREGYHPGTMILDTPITVRDTEIGKSWKPQNFELEYKGEVTCREAVMNSMNVPALKTMEKVGIKEVLKFARRLGIKTELKEELGTAIGSSCVNLWELTNVYTTWARMGLRPEPVFLKRILDRDGHTLEEHASPNDPWQTHVERLDSLYRSLLEPPVRSLDAIDAYLAHYLLTQVAQHGTAARASRLKKPVAGKTGTTNDNFDTWFAGYAPSLVTTVWVGYDTNEKPLSQREQGGRTSLPIWLEFMMKSLDGKDEPEWLPPEGVCFARVDSKTGARVFDVTPGSFAAPFRCGEEPRSVAVSGGLSVEDAIKSGGM